jgi:hypothetical protein
MPTVLFVCPHGAGKSRLAAAFFDRVAPPGWRATTAGPEPDPAVSAAAIRLLAGDAAEAHLDREPPRPLTAVVGAAHTVAIDCAQPADERWTLARPQLDEATRDELRARAETLARTLARRGEGT